MIDIRSTEEKLPTNLELPIFLYPQYWDHIAFQAGKKSFRTILEEAKARYDDGTWAQLFLTRTKNGIYRVKKESVALYIVTYYLLVATRETDRDSRQKIIWWYDPESGFWRPNARQKISQLVQMILQKHNSTHYTREIIAHIENYTLMKLEFNQEPHLLAVRNGVVDLYTKDLLPYNPRYLLTNGINAKYNPKILPNIFLDYLDSTLHHDYQLLIQELFGDIIFKEYRWQRIFFFYGKGRNGKGTLIRVIKEFLGEGNYATQYFHDLQRDKNARAELEGKYVNFAGDMSKKPLKDTNVLKHLRGQEPMSARHLYENFFNFTNYAILIANCNKPPRIEDNTESWEHTVMLIRFDKTFAGQEADRELVAKLTTDEELSGILNWAIEGLHRLLKNGDYSDTESSRDMFEQYKEINSPVYAYSRRYLEFSGITEKKWAKNSWICDKRMWEGFRSFCTQEDLELISKTSFTQELQKIFPKVKREVVRRGERGKDGRKKGLLTWIGLDFLKDVVREEDFELDLEEDTNPKQGKLVATSSVPEIPTDETETIQDLLQAEVNRLVKQPALTSEFTKADGNGLSEFFFSIFQKIEPTKLVNGAASLELLYEQARFLTAGGIHPPEFAQRIVYLMNEARICQSKEGFFKPV